MSVRIAAMFATILYPDYLTVPQLLTLIDLSQLVREHVVEGFPYVINQLYEASDKAPRSALLGGLSELCLSPPFAADYQQISRKHAELASRLHPLARLEVLALGAKEPPPWLIRLLMVVERAEHHHGSATKIHRSITLCGRIDSLIAASFGPMWDFPGSIRSRSIRRLIGHKSIFMVARNYGRSGPLI